MSGQKVEKLPYDIVPCPKNSGLFKITNDGISFNVLISHCYLILKRNSQDDSYGNISCPVDTVNSNGPFRASC